MYCSLCSQTSGLLIETRCNHSFHLHCLQQKWKETSTFYCPTCHNNIGLVITENQQSYIVFETQDRYQAVYRVSNNAIVQPIDKIIVKWKRVCNRLTKRVPSILKKPIIVN